MGQKEGYFMTTRVFIWLEAKDREKKISGNSHVIRLIEPYLKHEGIVDMKNQKNKD